MTHAKDVNTKKKEKDFVQFYKKLEGFVPELKKFIEGSLKAAENLGLLDKGFYKTDEILDEIYLETYGGLSSENDPNQLHIFLFKRAIIKMEAIKAQEVPDGITYHSLLNAEMKTLSEKFTTDGDGDRIMFDELDDISYYQNRGWVEKIFLYEPLERQLVEKLGLHETSLLSDEKRRLLWVLYSTIPQKSKTVVELLVFGNQDLTNIADILDVPSDVVDRILFKVKERFKLV